MATQTKKPPLTVSNPWWGHDPSDKQLKALWVYEECPDLFYGGAAGPGKTSYLLMAAVQYVHHPHYRARAFQSMVGGGMEVERAAGLAGLTGVA